MDFDPVELIGGALGRSVYELLRRRLAREILVAAPVAGADWSVAAPPGVVWEPVSVRARLVTSAVVATRVVELQVADGANVVAGVAPVSTHAASLSGIYDYAKGTTGTAQTTSRLAMSTGIPDIGIQPGWTIGVSTANIDVGDQWGLIAVVVREWSPALVQQNLDWILEQLRRETP